MAWWPGGRTSAKPLRIDELLSHTRRAISTTEPALSREQLKPKIASHHSCNAVRYVQQAWPTSLLPANTNEKHNHPLCERGRREEGGRGRG